MGIILRNWHRALPRPAICPTSLPGLPTSNKLAVGQTEKRGTHSRSRDKTYLERDLKVERSGRLVNRSEQ